MEASRCFSPRKTKKKERRKIRRGFCVSLWHSASSTIQLAGRRLNRTQKKIYVSIKSTFLRCKMGHHSRQSELSLVFLQLFVKLSICLIWFFGPGVQACTSSTKHIGDYRVIRKTDSESDRVVVSLDEDTR